MLSLSIPELLAILLKILIIIVKITLIFIIGWLGGRLFRWIWRSLIVPIFQRRAYFYAFKEDDDGFYVERPIKILWFRLRRNKRWALQKDLIGYVAKRTGGSETESGGNQAEAENDIFFTSFTHKTHVGQVNSPKEKPIPGGGKMTICEVILKRSNLEGDTDYDTPVGFINDKGEVYKYYKDRNAALKGEKLGEPELIGYARTPQLQERKNFPGSYDTDAEAAIKGIDDTAEHLNEWYFFRKRKKSKVKSQKIKTQNTNKGYLALWTAGWRVLHAHLIDTNPDRKQRPWGIGYAVEDFWRNLFTKDAKGFSLDARAVAALLLAEKEGFYLREGEQGAEGMKGLWPTAMLAFVCYLCAFPFLTRWTALMNWFEKLFEGIVGPQISTVIALIALFFGIWLIVHLIRLLFYDATDKFESLLYKMNNNVGTSKWNTELIIVSALGLILSIFMVDYLFFPIFFCALVVFIGQRVVFPPEAWPIEYPYDESEDQSESEDETDNDESEYDELIEHSAFIFAMGKDCELKFKVPYENEGLKGLRATNLFREGNTPEYSQRIRDMIEKECRGEVYSRINYVKDRIDRFVAKHHLSYIEKINLILKLAQPDNITYEYDSCCPELLPQSDEPRPAPALLEPRRDGEEGQGYIEYCRYPSETLHDKRGDCDCHAALAVGLLAACGVRCCYFTNYTNDDSCHAAFGIEVTEDTKTFLTPANRLTYNGKEFIYTEATGHDCYIGKVPEGFEDMLKDTNRGTYAIVEPFLFNKELSDEK